VTTVADFVGALRSSNAVPGGGSAAALAGALGAALLGMVGGMAGHRAGSADAAERLQAAGRRSSTLSERLTALVDLDSDAYGQVQSAYKLPKASDGERAARASRIQDALRSATETPLEVMQRCADAIQEAVTVAELGNPNASSDVGVALELLGAALRSARLNVEINLGSIRDESYGQRVRERSARLVSESEAAAAIARSRLP
jgi:formiminotetrahydrofolate cyclodeaminase